MSVTREQAIEALFARISVATWGSPASGFGLTTRRPIALDQMASPGGRPGLVLIVHHERVVRKSPTTPPIRTMTALAAVYIDATNNLNAIPDSILNPIEDAIEAALAPDDFSTGRCTLGGLVYAAYVSGEIDRAPGDRTGKGVAIVPIDIILP